MTEKNKSIGGLNMEIKVLGAGCATCKKLHEAAKQAAAGVNAGIDVLYITDMQEIMKTGIMRMPGLMINGKMKSMGRVPSVKEIKQMIEDEM
jgi:small redox-active disulfide protein 2